MGKKGALGLGNLAAGPGAAHPIPRGDGTMELRFWSPVNTPVVIDGEVRYVLHRVEDVSDIAGADAAQLAYELYGSGLF